jgi:hypothetical protein
VKNCTLGIVDDDFFEDDEILYLKLTRPLGSETIGAKIGEINSTEITITSLNDGNYIRFLYAFQIVLVHRDLLLPI